MTEARQCDKCLSLDRHPVNRALSMQIAVTRNLGTVVTAAFWEKSRGFKKQLRIYLYFRFFFSHSGNIHKQIYSLTGFHACKLWQNNYKRFRKNFQKVKLFLNSHSCVVLGRHMRSSIFIALVCKFFLPSSHHAGLYWYFSFVFCKNPCGSIFW